MKHILGLLLFLAFYGTAYSKYSISSSALESGRQAPIRALKNENTVTFQTMSSTEAKKASRFQVYAIQFETSDIDLDHPLNANSIFHLNDVEDGEITNQSIDPEVLDHFKVAPSPMRLGGASFFGYRLNIDMAVSIEIFDRRGRRLAGKSFNAGDYPGGRAGYNTVPIDSQLLDGDVPAGIYYALLFYDGNVVKRTKFEIQP